jgi:hypothetical protein
LRSSQACRSASQRAGQADIAMDLPTPPKTNCAQCASPLVNDLGPGTKRGFGSIARTGAISIAAALNDNRAARTSPMGIDRPSDCNLSLPVAGYKPAACQNARRGQDRPRSCGGLCRPVRVPGHVKVPSPVGWYSSRQ